MVVDSLTGPRRSGPALREAIERGHRLLMPALVLFEWLRGPRVAEELAMQEALFPREEALPFGPHEAATASRIYVEVSRPRGREIDLAIAATALEQGARLWTLNPGDFGDIRGLKLYAPKANGSAT